MPPKSKLTKSLENIESAIRTFTLYEGSPHMPVIIEQNEVKSYTILTDKIIYVTKEVITSKNLVNITIFFSTGQNIKIGFPLELGEEVYMSIQSQLSGA